MSKFHNNPSDKSNGASADFDQKRRQALKVAAASAASATVLASTAASALQVHSDSSVATVTTAPSPALGEFSMQVHHSWASNDLAVVITNRGSETRSITAITPQRLELPRGVIDFAKVLESGELSLAPGESVEVPLTPVLHKAVLSGSGYGHFDRSIQNMLKERVSITTESQAFAAVTVVPGPMLV